MNRKQARAAAMKLIYEWEMGGDGGEDTLTGILEIEPGEPEEEYTRTLVESVKADCGEIDKKIEAFARGWTLERMARVDLAILRTAVGEMRLGSVPSAVAVSEAVDLSREYSTDKSGSFINGVLGNIARAASEA